MKKIISKQELKKKQQRKQLIAGSVLVVVMLFSTIAYSFMDNKSTDTTTSSTITYNGVKFTPQGNYFVGEKYNNQVLFFNNPKELNQNVYTNFTFTSNNYLAKPLYISSDDYLVAWQLNQVLGPSVNKIAQRVQSACYDDKNCPDNYPIKTCEDNLILVRYSNTSEINSFDNCIIISGPQENISQISDLFVMKIFGI